MVSQFATCYQLSYIADVLGDVYHSIYIALGAIAMFCKIFLIKKVLLHSHWSLISTCIHALTGIKMHCKKIRLFSWIYYKWFSIFSPDKLFWKSCCVHCNWAAVNRKVSLLYCSLLYHFEIWIIWGVQIHIIL